MKGAQLKLTPVSIEANTGTRAVVRPAGRAGKGDRCRYRGGRKIGGQVFSALMGIRTVHSFDPRLQAAPRFESLDDAAYVCAGKLVDTRCASPGIFKAVAIAALRTPDMDRILL